METTRYCGACGFAMSKLDDTCPRCGAGRGKSATAGGFPKGRGKPTAASGPPGPAQHVTSQPFRPTWASVALVAVLGAAAAALVVSAMLTGGALDARATLGPSSLTGVLPRPPASLPAGTGLPESPASRRTLPGGIGGLFQATPSDSVIPIVAMHNASDVMVYVVFLGPTNTTKSIAPWGSVEFQLPQGMYQVQVWAVGTERRQGTALFRRLTRYDCTWEIVSGPYFDEAPPLRLGDPH